jgi:hypothetical protein
MSDRALTFSSRRAALAPLAIAAAVAVAGCGGSSSHSSTKPANPAQAEVSPPGDIPDNQAFVRFTPPGGGYSVAVPEGWARTTAGGAVVFTDKLNSVRMESKAGTGAPTLTQARSAVRAAAGSSTGFRLGHVSTVARNAGKGVRVDYLITGKPDPVTGKTRAIAVERYTFVHAGKVVTLTLSGAKGADNVDPWRHVTDSLRWSR